MNRVNMIKGMVTEGNTCLFSIFVLFNFFMFLASLGLLGVSIYLFAFTKDANVFNISFLSIAIVLVLFSVCAFRMRRSVHLLGCYIFILTIVFIFQAILTILVIVFKDKLIEEAKKYVDNSSTDIIINELNAHFKDAAIALVAFSIIVGLTVLFGLCYRCSVKKKTFKMKENLLNEERYNESVKKLEAVAQQNQEKRMYYEQKYPDLKQYSMNSSTKERQNSLK